MKSLIAIVVLLGASGVLAAPPHLSEGMLVDERGMTLYAYAGKGTPDAPACAGACELNFPPAIADKQDTPNGSLTLVSTQTGERQWAPAYKGHPLYHGRMDKKPGDRHADGLNEAWYSVRP